MHLKKQQPNMYLLSVSKSYKNGISYTKKATVLITDHT